MEYEGWKNVGEKMSEEKKCKGGKGGYKRMYNDEKLKRVDDC